jgi:REP element-mobilizing transposase RayT
MKTSSRRSRKRHVQQELFRRGGKRRGAGRKPKGARAGSLHQTRPTIRPNQALHIVLRVVSAVGSMRRRLLYKAMRDATITAGLRERVRIVHISLQRTHVHMLVEADNTLALARGMQGFQVSAARNINTALGVDKYRRRRGPVFADRYHLEVITSPTRAHRALSYVLIIRPMGPRTTATTSTRFVVFAPRTALGRRAVARLSTVGEARCACAASERDARVAPRGPLQSPHLAHGPAADTSIRVA